MGAIDVAPRALEIVLDVLARHLPDHEVRLMGSRVTGHAKPFSDLDLIVMGDEPLGLGTLAGLRDAFDDSDLPFAVDIIEWSSASESFRRLMAARARVFRLAGSVASLEASE